ncbi:MAG: imidazole glycerol phosphate synthase subunit HisH [Candidatus Omnitrophica bacterium]|nr:imidazole glycerol phosphate synthase subunit HisH [Candidatus Omnitrophota bacterium]
MLTIIDLGLGNINSVHRALKYLKIEHLISNSVEDISRAQKLIFPGVGSFAEASRRLYSSGIAAAIKECVLEKCVPILGICLGMQLLAGSGEEGGVSQGLGLINACVRKLRSEGQGFHLPHIGWNDISFKEQGVFSGIQNRTCFYFVHSYEMILNESDMIKCAVCNYGVDFIAAVKKDNIVGVQFHPEKSREPGLKLLKNFVEGAD